MAEHAAGEARRRWKMDAHHAEALVTGDESTGGEAARDLRRRERTYDQSMSGRKSSQRTLPPDSRSSATAKSPPSLLPTYTALRKYPVVVPQRRAKAVRSVSDSDLRYARSVSITRTVPKGTMKTSPAAHVLSCTSGYHADMPAKDPATEAMRIRLQEVRRARLRLLLEQYESMTHFADAIGEPLNYTSRLVKLQKSGRKHLGEGKARKIEATLGLPRGWLDRDNDTAPVPVARNNWPFSPRLPRAIWDNLSPAEQRKAEGMLLTIINGIESERVAQGQTG